MAQPRFVVIVDEPPAQVRLRATNTVKRAVDRLHYFQRDPVEFSDIWLFRDRTSYTNHARLLFNDTDDSVRLPPSEIVAMFCCCWRRAFDRLSFPLKADKFQRMEIVFGITQEADGGFVAECLSHDIFTQGDNWEQLRKNVQEAVSAYFFDQLK